MSVGFRHSDASGLVDPKDVDAAESDLVGHESIDHDHDVPFVAGMSTDGKTLYVDHQAWPMIVKEKLLRPLVVHESVENELMTKYGMKYGPAHAIATAAEEGAAKANGHSLSDYNAKWDRIIRAVSARARYPNVPKDLNTKPYVDEGEMDKLLGAA